MLPHLDLYDNAMTFTQWMNLIVSGKAAKNWYDVTGDAEVSFNAAWGAFVRWTVWTIALGVWWTILATMWFVHSPGIVVFLHFAISPFLLGVTWCRTIDFCLFRQGLIYKLFRPIAARVEPVPTWAFYCLPILPIAV